jgi:UDP-glucuronate 4-epimerase
MSSDERFLVTGAKGCIGAWAVRCLLREGTSVVAFDLDTDPGRLRLLVSDDELGQVQRVAGDISDTAEVNRVVANEGITNIVHLAALQQPFCLADPPRGASVNVVGTVNIFEAVARHRDQVRGLTYASSGAVFGPPTLYPHGLVRDDSQLSPSSTIYGVYKQANEWTARVYAEAQEIGSIGLRPFVVYGPGRDQGRTSTPTVALVAAAAGRPYHINYGGTVAFQYAEDVARLFIRAARCNTREAHALNVGASTASMAEWIATIEEVEPAARGLISYEDLELPFPSRVDASGVERLLGPVPTTALRDGIQQSIAIFRDLLARGLIEDMVSSGRA